MEVERDETANNRERNRERETANTRTGAAGSPRDFATLGDSPRNPASFGREGEAAQSADMGDGTDRRDGRLAGLPAVEIRPDVGEVGDVIGAFRAKKNRTNAPKIVGEMPQMPQGPNAPNAPTLTIENTTFAQPTGWSKLWRLERNGLYFKYRLRFTNSNDTPQEFKRVTRQGGKISPKIERALAKRPGSGRHAASRVEAGRFRSRAFDIAGRIRSSAGRGADGEAGAFAAERGNTPPQDIDRSLGRSDMPQLSGVDRADDLPSVRESDWVM